MKKALFLLLSLLPLGVFAQNRKSFDDTEPVNILNSDVISQLQLDPELLKSIAEMNGVDKIVFALPDKKMFYMNVDAQRLTNSNKLLQLVDILKSQLGEGTDVRILHYDEVQFGTQDWEPTK